MIIKPPQLSRKLLKPKQIKITRFNLHQKPRFALDYSDTQPVNFLRNISSNVPMDIRSKKLGRLENSNILITRGP